MQSPEKLSPIHPCPQLLSLRTTLLGELSEPVVHRYAPAEPGQSPDTVLERCERFVGPAELTPSESELEEHHFVDAAHPALRLIDLQLQLGGQVPNDAGLDTFTGSSSTSPNPDLRRLGSLADPALNLPQSSVRTSSRTKAEARLGEFRIEDRRKPAGWLARSTDRERLESRIS